MRHGLARRELELDEDELDERELEDELEEDELRELLDELDELDDDDELEDDELLEGELLDELDEGVDDDDVSVGDDELDEGVGPVVESPQPPSIPTPARAAPPDRMRRNSRRSSRRFESSPVGDVFLCTMNG